MRNTIIFSIVLLFAVLIAGVYYFSNLDAEEKLTNKPLTHIPSDAFLISTFINEETTDRIFKDYEIFEALLGREQIAFLGDIKNQILRNGQWAPYFQESELFLSLHPDSASENMSMLITASSKSSIAKVKWNELLKFPNTAYNIGSIDTLGQNFITISDSSSRNTLLAAYQGDVLFASPSVELLAKALQENQQKLSKEQIEFYSQHDNRNSPLSVYVDHKNLDELLKKVFKKKGTTIDPLLKGISGWSAWNMSFKNDALILTGESTTSHQSYISLFTTQTKTAQRLYSLFPSNTAVFVEAALSDKSIFQNNWWKMLAKRQGYDTYEQQIGLLEKEHDLDLLGDFNHAFGNHMALIKQSNGVELAYLSIRDSSAFSREMGKGASEVEEGGIFRLDHSNLLYILYGDFFKNFSRPYFAQVDDVLVFANNLTSLRQYLRQLDSKQLLIGDVGFQNMQSIQGNDASLTFFRHTKNVETLQNRNLKEPFLSIYRNTDNYGYQDFYSWSFQLSGSSANKGFVSNLYGVHKSQEALGSQAEWKYKFNNRPITRPYIMEHSDTSQFIIMQEQDHTVHGIAPSGDKLWSAVFYGRIVGDFIQLPDRSIAAVTHQGQLYLFSPTGKGLPGYSLAMRARPSSGPVYYQDGSTEALLVPAGKNILAYDLQGNALDLFKDIELSNTIVGPLWVEDGSIIWGTENGTVYTIDKQGNASSTENPKEVLFKHPYEKYEDSEGTSLVNIDTTGQIYQYQAGRVTELAKIKKNSADFLPHFLPDRKVVVLDGQDMQLYGIREEEPLRTQHFAKTLPNMPGIYFQPRGEYKIGFTSSDRLIYLLNDNGSMVDGFPIEGMPLFYYGRIDYNSATYLLCFRLNHTLYAFKHNEK